jgi:hypothetical protein
LGHILWKGQTKPQNCDGEKLNPEKKYIIKRKLRFKKGKKEGG